MDSDRGSISQWLEGLREGESLAAQQLWNRYFLRLAEVAQKRFLRLPTGQTGEDVALSAMKSLMLGVQENRYPDLHDRCGLWPLLITITARKSISEQRRQYAQKRTRAREKSLDDLQAFLGEEPSAEFAVELRDELERLDRTLNDETLSRIVIMKLEGASHEEIAEKLNCSARTVIRKLNRIRQEWISASEMSEAER